MGSPNTGLSAVLAPRALEADQVPRDGADRPPHAVPLGHHLLRLADAQAVAVHGGCEPASGRGSAACGQRPGQLQLAVPACLYLNDDDVHVPSLGQAARAGQPSASSCQLPSSGLAPCVPGLAACARVFSTKD